MFQEVYYWEKIQGSGIVVPYAVQDREMTYFRQITKTSGRSEMTQSAAVKHGSYSLSREQRILDALLVQAFADPVRSRRKPGKRRPLGRFGSRSQPSGA